MVQWNSNFINAPILPCLSKLSGAVQVGSYNRQAGRQADETQMNFKNFRIHYKLK